MLAKNCKGLPTGGKWADPVDPQTMGPPEDIHEEVRTRLTFEGPLEFDYSSHAPLNPRGRTGMWGRGLLGAWGANHAADPIVTRWSPHDRTKLQMVAIERKDTGEWAIPGGMVDPGESVSATVRREFEEEAGAFDAPAIQARRRRCSNGLLLLRVRVSETEPWFPNLAARAAPASPTIELCSVAALAWQAEFRTMCDELFSNGEVVYQG